MLVENEKFGITHRNSRTQFIQCLPVWRLTISYVLPSIPPVAVILIFSDRTEGQLCKTFCVLNIEILGLTVLQVASPRGLLTLKQRVVLPQQKCCHNHQYQYNNHHHQNCHGCHRWTHHSKHHLQCYHIPPLMIFLPYSLVKLCF